MAFIHGSEYGVRVAKEWRDGRSRDGCLTCKKRKVKCDEQRPVCSHCERLDMGCAWRWPSSTAHTNRQRGRHWKNGFQPGTQSSNLGNTSTLEILLQTPSQALAQTAPINGTDGSATGLWEFADTEFWNQIGATFDAAPGIDVDIPDAQTMGEDGFARQASSPTTIVRARAGNDSPGENNQVASPPLDNGKLLDLFKDSCQPTAFAETESRQVWTAMRQSIIAMASNSSLVYSAVLAFSTLILDRRMTALNDRDHYKEATLAVASHHLTEAENYSAQREHTFVTLFFLSYINILQSQIKEADNHLKQAFTLFKNSNKNSLSSIEKQVLLWMRLLDGRTVGAGGQGLFLSEETELSVVSASPTSTGLESELGDASQELPETDVEDIFYQTLCQPGLNFFHKLQNFVGRTSKIDRWHRSRGTVQDETEVMRISERISEDLRTFYHQRPPLMDLAVAGKLREPYLPKSLIPAVSRAYRTYLANYYASVIHLHRVAYAPLPLTGDAFHALEQIHKLALLLDEDESKDSLPRNMLWPLLMLGVEELEEDNKAWIDDQLRRMESIAENAGISRQVLIEVQARQSAMKTRVDFRGVMHEVCHSFFAIV